MKRITYSLFLLIVATSCTKDLPDTIVNSIGMEFILVNEGTFNMGDEFGDGFEVEFPVHKVSLSNYYIGKYEVRQKEWLKIDSYNPSKNKGDDFPVERINWRAAMEFIKKLNKKDKEYYYRLPTEAEWEFAAKGGNKGSKTIYSGNDDPLKVAQFNENSGMISNKVGSLLPNELGIYDMSGNVSEWCSGWYSEDYFSNSPLKNPKGPTSGTEKVIRGGSWYSIDSDLRVTDRDYEPIKHSNDILGFRLIIGIR